MLEESIRKRIVGTIFECTEHHQTLATLLSVPEDLLQAHSTRQTDASSHSGA